MLDSKIYDLLNKQINKEIYASYIYLDIANYYNEQSLDGFANWFDIQTKEELEHADLIIQYLRDNGQKIVLDTIEKPNFNFNDFKEPLKVALEHERFITASINEIYDEAFKQRDFRTMKFLDWFVKEQAEEEKNAEALCDRFELFGQDSKGLYMLDQELGARKYESLDVE